MAGAITYLQAASDPADLTTYTFASQNLGTASSDRYIIASFTARLLGTSAVSISSVTVGGVSATIIAQQTNSSSNRNICGLAIAAVPSGTTGDVVVVISRSALRASVQLWAATGISPTVVDSATSTATLPTYDIDVPADGIAVASVMSANTVSSTWSGLTERFDFVFDGSGFSTGASDAFASTQTNLTVTASLSTSSEQVGAFASFGPSSGGGLVAAALQDEDDED